MDDRESSLMNLPASTSTCRLLVVRLRSLGDTVLMTPALAAAKRLPQCRVGVVVEEPFDEILRGNPSVDRLFVIKKGVNKLMARFRTLQEIRSSFKPDVAIDLHGGTTSAFMTAFSGAGKRVGYAGGRNVRWYNVRIPDSRRIWGRSQIHTVEHQLSPFKYLGFPVEPIPDMHVPIDGDVLRSVQSRIARWGISQGFTLMHPGAAFDTKQWETKKFASLASRLTEEGWEVIVTVGPDQESLLEEIRRQCRARVWFLKPQSIREFTALTSLCGLYVGNDTGATHIAAALGRKIVVVWGSSDFKVWYPWNVSHRLVKADLPCIPCPGYTCLYYDEPRCIRSIEVEPVWQAVKALQ